MKGNKVVKGYVLAIITFFCAYGFASWAIDSGSIAVYALAFIVTYAGIILLKEALKAQFRTHDKTSKAQRVTKAH